MDPFGSVVFIGDDRDGMGFVVDSFAVITATHVVRECAPALFRGGDPGDHLIPVRPFRAPRRSPAVRHRLVFADLVSDVAVLASRDSTPLAVEQPLAIAEPAVATDGAPIALRVPTQSGRIGRYRAQPCGPLDTGVFATRRGGWRVTFGDSGAPVLDRTGRAVALVSAGVGRIPGARATGRGGSQSHVVDAYFALLAPALPLRLRPTCGGSSGRESVAAQGRAR